MKIIELIISLIIVNLLFVFRLLFLGFMKEKKFNIIFFILLNLMLIILYIIF